MKLPFETWEYEEQTKLKHKVFRDYFDKWVKIIASSHGGRINYIDGFAGIGAYSEKGKIVYGSPIIAAEVIKDNSKFVKKATLVFIDKKPKSINNLKKVIAHTKLDKLENITIHTVSEDFNAVVKEILDKNRRLLPTFVFIDPFGFGAIKYKTIKRYPS